MELFKKGDRISVGKDFAEVVCYLASGRQGNVYKVIYSGDEYALKWYKPDAVSSEDMLERRRGNLLKLMECSNPDPSFLWPVAITDVKDGSFGFIMPLIPENYVKLRSFLTLDTVNFSSFRGIVRSCLRIASAFRNLGYSGFSYLDINDDNFFIDPETDDVLICDNDNITPVGTDMGIRPNPKYAAPETVVGGVMPNTLSDRHSLAVIIFRMLFSEHPLEGKCWIGKNVTKEYADLVYGGDPVFIFDPCDRRNAPVEGIQDTATDRWELAPDSIKDIFCKAFSRKALTEDPNYRPTENDWLCALADFGCGIAVCPCGNEVFLKEGFNADCDNPSCSNTVTARYGLQLRNRRLPLAVGAVLYKCQLGICDVGRELDPILQITVRTNDCGTVGARNVSNAPITVITAHGRENTVEPGRVFPLMSRMKLVLCGQTFEVI